MYTIQDNTTTGYETRQFLRGCLYLNLPRLYDLQSPCNDKVTRTKFPTNTLTGSDQVTFCKCFESDPMQIEEVFRTKRLIKCSYFAVIILNLLPMNDKAFWTIFEPDFISSWISMQIFTKKKPYNMYQLKKTKNTYF